MRHSQRIYAWAAHTRKSDTPACSLPIIYLSKPHIGESSIAMMRVLCLLVGVGFAHAVEAFMRVLCLRYSTLFDVIDSTMAVSQP